MKRKRLMAVIAVAVVLSTCSSATEERRQQRIDEFERTHLLKDEIKREILQELMTELALEARGETPETTGTDRDRFKAELRREILAELEQRGPKAPSSPPATGSITGRVTRSDEGVAGVEILAVKLVEGESFLDMFESVQYGSKFEATTDPSGNFAIEGAPLGGYEIRWKPPGDARWMRRLREEPDAIVRAGGSATVNEIRLDAGRVVGKGKP